MKIEEKVVSSISNCIFHIFAVP